MDEEQLLRQFVAEAEDLAEALRADIEALSRQQAAGRVAPDLLNRVFRSAHSIKGMAGMAGADAVARAAHRFEDLLDDLRMGRIVPDAAFVAGCARVADDIGETIRLVARGKSADAEADRVEAEVASLREAAVGVREDDISALVDLDERVRATLTDYETHRLRENLRERRPVYEARVAFDLTHFDKGFRSVADGLAAAGEVLSTLPGAAADDPMRIAFRIVFASDAPVDDLEALVAPAGGELVVISRYPEAEAVEAAEPAARVASSVRVDIGSLEELAVLGETLALRTADLAAHAEDLAERLGVGARELFDLRQKSRSIGREFAELEERVVDLRLVPLAPTFERARRRVLAIANDLDRDVECEVVGEDVRLDKAIVDGIAEPLAHLLSNAVAHGVEPADERVAAGKPAAGRVTLRAEPRGNRVAISVSDDGRGIDAGALDAEAARLGLGVGGMAAAFLPGVSTADEVSDVSGRGVGLDAVASAAAALGGEVDVASEQGKGTTFTVTLPTTLVVASVFLATAGGGAYAIDVSQVAEVGVVAPATVTIGKDGAAVVWRGERIPLYRLATLVRAAGEQWETATHGLPCVIARTADRLAAVTVDDFVGEREVVVKSLGSHARAVRGVTGGIELEGDRVALLVDIPTLVAERRRGAAPAAGGAR